MLSYEDAMDESCTVTRKDAERECTLHCCDVSEMIAVLGDKQEYKASDVLRWLGY